MTAKPRIFLGSSGAQTPLLVELERGLEDVADVIPWTTSFNPGQMTLDRLFELAAEVDFAVFVFARDDWTTRGEQRPDAPAAGQASPRDNVVYEAGLFGGLVGMRRTFILHANGAKLPTDLLGLTCVRYEDSSDAAEIERILSLIRTAIAAETAVPSIVGSWWQFSLTARDELEPSVVALATVTRERDRTLSFSGRAWQEDGTLSARYQSRAATELRDPSGIFYYALGERPRHPGSPQFEATGEIRLESADRATGYYTGRTADPIAAIRTAGVYLRAKPEELAALDADDDQVRAELVAALLRRWAAVVNA